MNYYDKKKTRRKSGAVEHGAMKMKSIKTGKIVLKMLIRCAAWADAPLCENRRLKKEQLLKN